jgi:hypothetical protein
VRTLAWEQQALRHQRLRVVRVLREAERMAPLDELLVILADATSKAEAIVCRICGSADSSRRAVGTRSSASCPPVDFALYGGGSYRSFGAPAST